MGFIFFIFFFRPHGSVTSLGTIPQKTSKIIQNLVVFFK